MEVISMPLARRVTKSCARCGDDSNVWLFEKTEPTMTKEQYSCEMCGSEWTEVRQD
jgi:DNA-directed RNA polymerase subunit M/transcription elongation factor TFIIS